MKRAILCMACFACCGGIGCDTQSTARLILTVGLNIRPAPGKNAGAAANLAGNVVATSERPVPRAQRLAATDALVAALQEIDSLCREANAGDAELATRLSDVIDRLAEGVRTLENNSTHSAELVHQAREAQAVALARAAELLPREFAGRRDAYCRAAWGRAWDRDTVERQAINRLVSGYLVASSMPADAPQVLALHAVTFPDHSMNVDLYATIADRLVGEGNLLGGLQLLRAGQQYCADQPDIDRLPDRLRQIYREHPGQVGVPMNFAGPTLRERRFVLNSLQGRPVLVVFWSPAEPAASKFMDSCLGLARRYCDGELEVVGVNLGANLQDAQLWLVERGFSCRQVCSAKQGHAGLENPIARFYGVTALPEFFLLDREGIVIARGANELGVLENHLRQLTQPRRLAAADRPATPLFRPARTRSSCLDSSGRAVPWDARS